MRQLTWSLVVLAAGVLLAAGPCGGCGSTRTAFVDAGHDGSTVDPDAGGPDLLRPDVDPPQPCAPAVEVTTSAELVTRLEALVWQSVGPYTSATLVVSEDIRVLGEVTVDAAELALPQECAGRSDCRPEIVFPTPRHSGVRCKTPASVAWLDACRELVIANTTLRFVGVMYDTHPAEWNFVPAIQIEAACTEPCAAGDLRCAANNRCYGSFETYCRLCLARDVRVCACLTADGEQADGTHCSFMVSGDVLCDGECRGGYCERTDPPGWAGCH